MAITAVSGVTPDRSRYMTFTGKKKTQKNSYHPQQSSIGSTAVKSAPIILLLALNSPDLNSGTQAQYMMYPQPLTTAVAPIPTNNISTVDIRNIRPDQPITPKQVLPSIFKDENIQYKKTFKMGGKSQTLYFMDIARSIREEKNLVTHIFLIPDDFSLIGGEYNNKNYPPVLQKFIYHDFGDPENKDYCTAVLHERRCDKDGENSRFVDLEVRLPEEVANDLIDLINDDTDLVASKSIKEMFYIMKH